MNKELETKLTNTLKAEFEYVKKYENDSKLRIKKMNDILRMEQIILNFDDLEDTLKEYFRKNAEKERFDR